MIGDISVATSIYIITGKTDMRKSINGLCAIVYDMMGQEINRNSIYLFCGTRCDRIKILLKEPDGITLLYKRLDVKGRYRGPRNSSEVKPITLWYTLNIINQEKKSCQSLQKISSFWN